MRILVFGSMNIDHVYNLPHFVRPGETESSKTYIRNIGGKGLNQAVALAKAGAETYFAGAIGEDGLFMKEYMEEVGIHTENLYILSVPSGHAIIQVNQEGQNSIVLYGGANQEITVKMIDETLSHFGKDDYVLLQNEISNVPYIINHAKERGMTVVLNPSPVSDDLLSWPLHNVDLFLLNEVEGEDITGEREPTKILDTLMSLYPNCRAVLTLGTAGSVYTDKKERIRQEAFKVHSIDTTAAGDTFTGYFLKSYVDGESVNDSMQKASKAAAISVTRKGASQSIPIASELP